MEPKVQPPFSLVPLMRIDELLKVTALIALLPEKHKKRAWLNFCSG